MKTITVVVDSDLEQIIPRYFELQRQGLEELARGVAEDDAETVRLTGHKMKGTGSSYGFPRLTELGAAIERAAVAGSLEEAADLARTAGDYLDRVRVIYREEQP
jgi:HPt (histidine-containing phosphotransfer) domain-containing protein